MKKIKFTPLIEKWSDQPLIEVTLEEWEELQNMDYQDRYEWLELNRDYSYSVVNVELNIIDDDTCNNKDSKDNTVENFSKMVHRDD
jgi:hypothetical protein